MIIASKDVLHHIAHLRKQCHNSKSVIFQEKCLKVLKVLFSAMNTSTQLLSSGEFCKLRYDTLYLLKVHLQTFLYQ
jgi:hypothetical protein